MLILGVVTAIAALVIWLMRLTKPQEPPVTSVRLTNTLIYCWHCMGDEGPARKTQLTTAGRCQCGSLGWTPAGALGQRIAEDFRHKREYLKWN